MIAWFSFRFVVSLTFTSSTVPIFDCSIRKIGFGNAVRTLSSLEKPTQVSSHEFADQNPSELGMMLFPEAKLILGIEDHKLRFTTGGMFCNKLKRREMSLF
jgi:hypothetical protein